MSTPNPQSNPIVFYDGFCGVCDWSVSFCIARDPDGRIKYAPLQGETARELVESDDIQTLNSLVFHGESGQFRRSAAVVRILWTLGGFWKFLGCLLWLVPLPIRNLGYRLFAKVRYRLFGKKEACSIPTPEERARFLP